MPNIFGLILTCVIVVIVFSLLLFLIKRYKKCPSDKVMVIYGKVGSNKDGSTRSAKCIHGGAAFIWPVIQSYEFLDLTPMSISVDLENALSRQNIRINVPSRFTVGVSTEPGVMQNAAERLLGLKLQEIQELAKDIIFGQLRLVIATMDIEEINTDRDKFLEAVSRNVEGELKKIGLRLINVNVTDISDESGYIDALGKLNGLRSSGVMPPPADLYCAGKPPVNWYGNAPRTVDEECYKKVEAYLDRKKITPKQAWINKYPTVSEIGDTAITEGNLAGFLHEYLYRHGQLRRKRDPFPTPVEFFTYLVDKYENCSKLRDVDHKRVEWTGVSLEGTPWPAMMALSETRPLRECDSVWERYMGQRGPTRLWLYGPYRMDDDKEPPILFSFDPDPEWSRESNERKLHEGGVCGTMSLISRNSQIARGIPAAPAGQPGHGNLMTTNFNGNGCWLSVGQSVDTLKATTGFWYFRDSKAPRTGNAEYQSGLALSMNIDYEKFIDSRFAMNIYKLAGANSSTEEAQDPSGTLPREFTQTAMRTVLKANPFYTEAWYTLFKQAPQDLMGATKMVDEVREALPDGMGIRKLWKTRKYVSSVGRGDKNGKEMLANHAKEYVNVLCSVILENALKQEHDYKTFQWADLMSWLKSETKRNSYPEPQAAYQIAYAKAQGTDRLKRTVDRGFKKALNFYRDENNTLNAPKDVDQQEMSFSLDALCLALPKEELLPWMKNMVDTCPDGFKYKPKNKKETKIHPFYSTLTKNYMSLADGTEKSRVKSEMKEASNRILELSQNKKGDGEGTSGRRRRR